MSTLKVNTISEQTAGQGVTIDGLAVKDGGLTVVGANLTLPASTATAGIMMAGATRLLHTFSDAGNSNTNVFVGPDSGNLTMAKGTGYFTAGHNVGVGFESLQGLATGGGNVGVGYRTLKANTDGIMNVAIGYQAMDANLTGNHNVAIGDSALGAATDSDYNVAIGWQALVLQTSGNKNIAIGYGALQAITTPVQNTGIGYLVGTALVDGQNNTLLGANAMKANVHGGNNVAVGAAALNAQTGGDSNTVVGYAAGYSNLTGSGNVFVGNQAGYYETASNKLFIDNIARNNEAGARTLALIYGVFGAAVANQTLVFNAGSMGFFGHAAAAQPAKASHNNWAALSDVVAALVEIGILDAA